MRPTELAKLPIRARSSRASLHSRTGWASLAAAGRATRGAPSCACGGSCPRCQAKSNLVVGEPDDRYEREADAVADRVMRMAGGAGPISHSLSGLQRKCAACESEDDDQLLQANAEPSSVSTQADAVTAPASVMEALSSPGQPLDFNTRGYFEPRFGHDFSRVRVHAGATAARSARDVNARAYTVGHDVVFGAGQFAPETNEGRRLFAHELTHVVQQSGADVVQARQGEGERGPFPVRVRALQQPDRSMRRLQRDLLFASGYDRPYTGHNADQQETRDAERGRWHPASIDMEQAAAGSGGGSGVSTLGALLAHVEARGKGAIKELDLIAHSNSSHFALAGTIDRVENDVIFDRTNALINVDTLKTQGGRIAKLRDRFAENARIVLYGCNAGSGKDLLDAISNAFQVCVHGFSDEVQYCITWNPGTRRISDSDRGRVWIANPNDPLPEPRPSCEHFFRSVKSLVTDRESCVGVPSKRVIDFDRLIKEFDKATIEQQGTDEEGVYRVLQTLERDPTAIKELRRRYRYKHKSEDLTLDAVIEDEFSGTELEYARQLVNRGGPETPQTIRPAPVKPAHWDAAARRLYVAFFDEVGTDEEAVYALLLPLQNDKQKLRQLEVAYAKLDKEMSLRQRIEDEMSGSELDYALQLLKKK